MDKENSKEKKDLKLIVRTPVDLKRYTSKQLHDLIEMYREKNKVYEDKYKDMSAVDYIREARRIELFDYRFRKSLINLSDRQKLKKIKKYREEFDTEKKELKEKLENEEITEEQYKNKKEQLDYKVSKKIYGDYMLENQEKPENPAVKRAVENTKNAAKTTVDTTKKAAKTTSKTIVSGASMVAGAIAYPFVMAYKGLKALGKGIVKLGRGGKIAALTAGKVASNTAKTVKESIKNQVEPIAKEVKEVENARSDYKSSKTAEERREIFDNASEKAQKAMMADDFKAALKENAKWDKAHQDIENEEYEYSEEEQQAKTEREEQRRENLHMDKETEEIDHEEANQKIEEQIEEETKRQLEDR